MKITDVKLRFAKHYLFVQVYTDAERIRQSGKVLSAASSALMGEQSGWAGSASPT